MSNISARTVGISIAWFQPVQDIACCISTTRRIKTAVRGFRKKYERMYQMTNAESKELKKLKADNATLTKKLSASYLLLEIVASLAENYKNQLPIEKYFEQCRPDGRDEIGMLLNKIRNLGERYCAGWGGSPEAISLRSLITSCKSCCSQEGRRDSNNSSSAIEALE